MVKGYKVTLNCPICNNDFMVYRYEIEQRKRIYCSNHCRGIARQIHRISKDTLLDAYQNQRLSTNKLASLFEVSKGTIYNWMKRYEIPTRSIGEGVSIAQTGKTHSEEWNQAIGRGNKGKNRPDMYGRDNPIFKSSSMGMHYSKSGKREDLGGLYVRSAWEANYCRYLNWLVEQGAIREWEYEPDTFYFDAIKRGTRSYTPDFKVTTNDGTIEYHEVKGWMDAKSKTKLKRMKKYHPNVKIVLVDKDVYYAIQRDVNAFIPSWER